MLRPPRPTRLIVPSTAPAELWVPGQPPVLDPPERTDEAVEDVLAHGEIIAVHELTTVDPTYHAPAVATYEDGTRAILKLGSHHGSWGEAAIRAEASAYSIDRAIGLHQVPVTVIRTEGGEQMSCQLLVEANDRGPLDRVPASELRRAAAFDLAIGQLDRIGKNWMVAAGTPPRLVLIDNGWAFDPPGDLLGNDGDPAQVRSECVKRADALGGPDFSILEPLEDPEVFERATALLGDAQVAGLRVRLARLRSAA